MKNYKLSLLALIALFMISCSESKQDEQSSYPMFWTWYNYRPNPDRPVNLDSIFRVMKETGLDGVILNCKTEEYADAIPVAHKNGLQVYAWWWGLNLEHDREDVLKNHPDWFQVNRLGQSLGDPDHRAYVDYYRFLCPALPEVREYLKNKIRALCEVDGLDAVVIDYTRFVDVILPTTLWPRYGIVQDREYPEWDYGYHPYLIEKFKNRHGYDPRELDDPSTDDLWLQFRCDQVTELVNEMAEIVHSYGKKMSASPFPTPAMSRRMVRQDWGKWNLDIVFPMIYKNFYTYDASFIADCTIENVKTSNAMTTVFAGLTALNSPEMFECMDAALNNGAEGICIFTIGSLRDVEVRAQFKAYTDSVRAARARSKVNPNATGITEVDTNPFHKAVIMGFVQTRIAAYTAVAKTASLPAFKNLDWTTVQSALQNALQSNTAEDFISRLQAVPEPSGRNPGYPELKPLVDAIINAFSTEITLSEYSLDHEFGTTRYYKVTELNSGIVFHVDFYLYGDLISGWNVEPQRDSYNE